MQTRWLRCIIVLALTLACLSAPGGHLFIARAQAALDLELFTPFAGQYVVGEWLPVRATLRNQGPTVNVTLAATLPDSAVRYTRTLAVAAGSEQAVWLYIFMERPASLVSITLIVAGAVVDQQELPLLLRPVERMRAAVGLDPAEGDIFAAGRLQVADLPDHPIGLSSLSVLALFALSEPLSRAQQDALLAWVYHGGHLIIGGGVDAVALQAALPRSLQAGSIAGAAIVDRQPLIDLGKADLPNLLFGVRLRSLTASTGDDAAPAPPWVIVNVGRGRVTQLAFAASALADWPARQQFWDALAQPVLRIPTSGGASAQIAARQAQTLTPALGALPASEVPAFTQGITALAIYTFVIFLLVIVLRRLRRRRTLVVGVASVAIFSSVAGLLWANSNAAPSYSAAQATLLEVIDADLAYAHSYLVRLAAMPGIETITFTSPALIRPMAATHRAFGRITGVSGDLPQQTRTLNLALEPWLAQGLTATATMPAPPVQAELTFELERLRVDVQNNSDLPLRDVFVGFGDQILYLGNIRPGGRSAARWPANPIVTPDNSTLGQLVVEDMRANGLLVGRDVEQFALLRASMIDAAVAAAPDTTDPGPWLLAWLDRDPLVAQQSAAALIRSEALLVMRLRITGQGRIILPEGWLRPAPEAGSLTTCRNGRGIQLTGSEAELYLRLPPDLAGLQAERIQLRLSNNDTPLSDTVRVQVRDWTTGGWRLVSSLNPATLIITDAAPYLRAGELAIKLSGALDTTGCLVVTGSVQGIVP